MNTFPVAIQTGTASEVTVSSRYSLRGAYKVLVEGEGVQGEAIIDEAADKNKDEKEKAKPLTSIKIRFTVAPDAVPGVRDFRIATPQGASTLGQLVITAQPVVPESGNNDTPEKPQACEVPVALCGRIEKAEDVDFYRFHAEAGSELNFHVRAQRLEDDIHDLQTHADPILTLRTSSGATLAASDNFFFADPLINYRFDRTGDYLIEVRDVRYQGNGNWVYSLEISSGPFAIGAHPLQVVPGQTTAVRPIGFHLPPDALAEVALPADAPPGVVWLGLPLPGGATNPVPLVVSNLPSELESEAPNDAPEQAQPVAVPAGISGRLEKPSDIDCYAFTAAAGDVLTFEVVARRVQSSLDSQLRILGPDGKQLAANDDMRLGKRGYADSWIENWTAPADGTYIIELRDVHLRGGDDFPYFIQVTPGGPSFELYLDTDKTELTPGTGGAIFVRAVRKGGFAGEIELAIDGLPQGVTAQCGRILEKGEDGCIVLQTAADAPQGIANIKVTGKAIHQPADLEPELLTAEALPYQEIYSPGGGRAHWPSTSHAVCVGAPGDIRKVAVSATEITLKPGESKTIDVTIERGEGYDKNVTLDVVYAHLNSMFGNTLPPGVTLEKSKSKTLLDGKTTTGQITLKADPAKSAPVARQLVPVLAHVSINFVMKATYAAEPLYVSVEPAPAAAEPAK